MSDTPDQSPATSDDVEALAELIWTTSRADESTISATGANIVARAILAAGYRRPSREAEGGEQRG